MKASSDKMHDKYKNFDFTDAKPVSETSHLAKLQAEAGARVIGQCGLDDRSIELGSGLRAFLEQPDLRERLLAGERFPVELWQ